MTAFIVQVEHNGLRNLASVHVLARCEMLACEAAERMAAIREDGDLSNLDAYFAWRVRAE